MRVGINSQLSSIWRSKKNLNSTQFIEFCSGLSEQIQPIGQAAEFKFESNSSPCRSSGNHSQRLFQKTIQGFDFKINGQALGAAFQHSFGWSGWRAQTQGVSELAAVAVGLDQLALGKSATTLAILTQFLKVLMLCICRYWATTSHFFCHVK